MKKQAIIIGLGQFGMALARALTDRGVEVLAVDISEERVRLAASFVTEAACFDATDEQALLRTGPERREVSVCAIGDEARDASIICTALLRQMGAPKVVARANTEVQGRILKLVGAHHVVNPEREYGERFASQLMHESIIGELPLGEDLLITELRVPPSFVGHTVLSLQLPRRYGVTVVAIRRASGGKVLTQEAGERLQEGDVLVVVSRQGAVDQLVERS
ncbi:MAG: TrkA family potassium uptake protein [Myxococcales bacterium]|nr:TrkA family potassium uptake protein [Myxococcales bacterium]MCB9732390.1 TrkA family potassium uptake protein [Deltaproteobacteria bacterium]